MPDASPCSLPHVAQSPFRVSQGRRHQTEQTWPFLVALLPVLTPQGLWEEGLRSAFSPLPLTSGASQSPVLTSVVLGESQPTSLLVSAATQNGPKRTVCPGTVCPPGRVPSVWAQQGWP